MKKHLLSVLAFFISHIAFCQNELPYVIPVINPNDMEHQMSADRYAQYQQSYQEFAARVANGPISFNEHGILAAKQGNYPEALKQFSEAINVSRGYADAYYNRGLVELKLYKTEDAIDDFNMAVSISPGNIKYLNQAADAQFANGNMKGAIRDYNVLLNLISTDSNLYLKRGRALADLTTAKQMGNTAADSLINAISPASTVKVAVLQGIAKPLY